MSIVPADNLEQRTAAWVHRWSVEVERTATSTGAVLLFGSQRGEPVVLKILREAGDEWRSGAVLAAFAGHGAARIHEHANGALLMEWLRPATPLVTLVRDGRDGEATDVLADVIAAMSDSPPAPAGIPTAADWRAGFDRYARSGDSQILRTLLEDAERVYRSLCQTQTNVRLLHGDLHHYNVLFDGRRGWLAVDPKGVVGEVPFEVAAALRNPNELPRFIADPAVMQRRVKQFAARLHVDEGRVIGWAFSGAVLSAVWSIEDGQPLGPATASLLLAKALHGLVHAT